MFLLDDLLVKPFLSLLDIIHTMALNEMYDIEELQNDLKETQLLYEIGDLSHEEYQQRKQELEEQLETAEQIQSQMRNRMEVKR